MRGVIALACPAVEFGCHGIKTGTVSGERTAKLNELIRIEETVKSNITAREV